MKRFIKVDADSWNSVVFDDRVLVKLWFYILGNANYLPKDYVIHGELVHIEPGQLAISQRNIAERIGENESKVRRCLEMLQELKKVTITRHSKYSLITVLNEEEDENKCEKVTNTRRTDENHSTNTCESLENQTNTIIESNIKKYKDTESIEAPEREPLGVCKNVYLSDSEKEALEREYADPESLIDRLSNYMASTGKRYASHYSTIVSWAKESCAKKRSALQSDLDSIMQTALMTGSYPINTA